MASSAKYLKALAKRKIVVVKRTSGEVQIVFKPTVGPDGKRQAKSVCLRSSAPVDLLARTDVTIDDVRRSNLDRLVATGAVDLI